MAQKNKLASSFTRLKKRLTTAAKRVNRRLWWRRTWGFVRQLPLWLRYILKSKWFLWTAGVLSGLIVLVLLDPYTSPLLFPAVKDPSYGVSFSAKRARELDLDPQAAFTALLDDLSIRNYRLMSYWDESEKERGKLDFRELDWQMDEAAKRGAKVTLGLGLRQPRWPECHQPSWAYELKGNEWKQALYAYMEIVVKRYENHPALESWQLENEAVNQWFGTCDVPDVERLNEEFNLVKSWSQKPVWMSLSDQHGYPINPPHADRYGFSVYRLVWNEKILPKNNYLLYPTPTWYHRLRAAIIKLYSGKEIFIHELQLEPWGPVDTKYLTIEEQNLSMSPARIHDNIYFARLIGEPDIYMWGSEWWYWRKMHGDPSIWEAIRTEMHTQR